MDRLLNFGFDNGVDLWRSEEMMLAQLMIPAESAHGAISALGEVGVLQFKDLNADKSAFQRTYANQVKRTDEMSRRLRFFHEQVTKAGLEIKPRPAQDINTYHFDELESKLEMLEKDLLEMNGNTERLQRSYAELIELQLVLEKAGAFFDSARGNRFEATPDSFGRLSTEPQNLPLLEAGGQPEQSADTSRIGFVAGTIMQDKLLGFERLLFRATRGNMFLRQMSIGKSRDPASGEEVMKNVFVVFFAGDRSKEKVHKICDVFNANRYPFPEDVSRQRTMHAEVSARLRELHTTNEAGERRRDAMLQETACMLDEWTHMVRKEKAIYHTLNKFSVDVTSKVLIAEAWVPVASKQQVQTVLRMVAENSSTQLSGVLQPLATTEAPPTHYTTNKFTGAFQNIVESYGVARYREVNPAVLTLMTFPFLFAVMFGDLGHGFLMFLFAAYLVKNEKVMATQNLGDMVGMLFGGRYCILLMAIFSMYTGILYNEFFSMPMAIFGFTHWKCVSHYDGNVLDVDPRDCAHHDGSLAWLWGTQPYVFGVDPIWHGTKTELPFLNSLKMKMSILLGVTHMNFGIIMSLFNNVYFRDTLSILWEFIPQIIFLNFIFGYLCILIITKWFTGSLADLYNVMIYMFLGVGKVTTGNALFAGQQGLQKFLLFVALISVPCMLLPKPLILKRRHEDLMRARGGRSVEMTAYSSADHDDDEARRPVAGNHSAGHGGGHSGGHGGHGHDGEFDFGEVMVHQMIHTIEFVLGAVSNTASYLRLWALSLAHSQLSAVFYDRVLMAGVQSTNVIALTIGFAVFACATLGVLMVMESLSAFLHALRLHWVEFMNKFYKGDGHKFLPFSFKAIEEAEKESEK